MHSVRADMILKEGQQEQKLWKSNSCTAKSINLHPRNKK